MVGLDEDSADDLASACNELAEALLEQCAEPCAHRIWRRELRQCDIAQMLARVRGVERIFFKSRDRDFEFVGFGAAEKLFASPHMADAELSALVNGAHSLDDDQIFFGALRFDENADIAEEWRDFGKRLFILPLVCITRRDGRYVLSINYRRHFMTWAVFQDRALTLLRALAHVTPAHTHRPTRSSHNYLPSKEHYAHNIHRALNAFVESTAHKKVVIGRRNGFSLPHTTDPAHLFCELRQKSRDAFLFFLDGGSGSAFFGASPELLYRRSARHLETESLAGTRARAHDEANDDRLRAELLQSLKDNQEHALVSLHIEEKLKDFGATEMSASQLEIMALAFVQHLLRRYHATIDDNVHDAVILPALHPTPAVCGLDIEWARDFIRTHEGFDRGFYAGPIGYITKDHAEFAVAIRSALFDRHHLYVYAACGIVPGSLHNQEWEELNNKEKSILSIFDDEAIGETK